MVALRKSISAKVGWWPALCQSGDPEISQEPGHTTAPRNHHCCEHRHFWREGTHQLVPASQAGDLARPAERAPPFRTPLRTPRRTTPANDGMLGHGRPIATDPDQFFSRGRAMPGAFLGGIRVAPRPDRAADLQLGITLRPLSGSTSQTLSDRAVDIPPSDQCRAHLPVCERLAATHRDGHYILQYGPFTPWAFRSAIWTNPPTPWPPGHL